MALNDVYDYLRFKNMFKEIIPSKYYYFTYFKTRTS